MDHATHLALGLDRILNGSPKARSNPCPDNPALVERPSPCADTRTAGVSVLESQYRARIYEFERVIDRLHDLMTAEQFDAAYTLVHAQYLAIHGSRS